jgi:Ca2+-binding RTX toxin-like protein
VFHSTNKSGWLNADGVDHVKGQTDVLAGKIQIGFEDLWRGGDKDYDDVVFTLDIGSTNVAAIGGGSGKVAKAADDDTMFGGDGDNVMYGVAGNDVMDGGRGNDKMSGGSGDDVMTGGEGDDFLMGNSGNDRFIADAGDDTIIGGSGFDTVDFSAWGNGVKVDLNAHVATGAGNDRIFGVESVIGTAFDDVLSGDKGANVLIGGAGDDVIRGRKGADTLTGGEGKDTFVWHGKDLDGSVDVVTDFSKGDRLDLRNVFKGEKGEGSDLVTFKSGADGLHLFAKVGGNWTEVAVLAGVYDQDLAQNALLV